MHFIADVEYEVMEYCLKEKGKWWANHFFRNKEVNKLYAHIRQLPLESVYKYILNR